MDIKKKSCSVCNRPGKHVKFHTFNYWYCGACKAEIGGVSKSSNWLDAGDELSCPECANVLAVVNIDVKRVEDSPYKEGSLYNTLFDPPPYKMYVYAVCEFHPHTVRAHKKRYDGKPGFSFHIKDKGWV